MDHRIRITLSGATDVEADSSRLLDGFIATAEDTGPVTSGDLVAKTIAVTFAVDEHDVEAALARGWDLLRAGVAAAGLDGLSVIAVEAAAVPAEELEELGADVLEPA